MFACHAAVNVSGDWKCSPSNYQRLSYCQMLSDWITVDCGGRVGAFWGVGALVFLFFSGLGFYIFDEA